PNSFRFSFCNFRDANSTAPIQIQPSEASRFAGRFSDAPNFVVYLDDQNRTKDYFDVNYRCLCALVSLLANQTEDEVKKSKTKLVVLGTKGPQVRCRLSRVGEETPPTPVGN